MEEWDTIHYRQRHQNRSKRKRYHRIEQRIEQLEKLDKRQHLIDRLNEAIGRDFTPASEIINAKSINEEWFESHSYGKLPRLDYIINLLDNYCPDFGKICRTGDHTIVVCYTTESYPLSGDEETRLQSFLSKHIPPESSRKLLFAIDNDISDEMALQFINIENPTKSC